MLRVLFFGIETQVLQALQGCRIKLAGVYLPPAPYWIRRRLPVVSRFPGLVKKWFNSVAVYGLIADFLEQNDIPALTADDVNSSQFRNWVGRLQPDLGVMCNFDQILGAALLAIPRFGFINMHPSILPRYRGPHPLEHILLNNDRQSGATWYQVTPGIDCGDILAQDQFPVEPLDTVHDVGQKAIARAIAMLDPLLESIEKQVTVPRPQIEAEATYSPMLTKKEREQLTAKDAG